MKVTSPEFLNAASNRSFSGLYLVTSIDDPTIGTFYNVFSCVVVSTKNGEYLIQKHEGTSLHVQADANTLITVIGDLSNNAFSGTLACRYLRIENTALYGLSITSGVWLTDLEIVGNKELQEVSVREERNLNNIKITGSPAIRVLHLYNNYNLQGTIDLREFPMVYSVVCDGCAHLQRLLFGDNAVLSYISIANCSALTDVNFTNLPALSYFNCNFCSLLGGLGSLRNSVALETLYCNYCQEITDLDLSKNTALFLFSCVNPRKLTTVRFRAIYEATAMAMAAAIGGSAVGDGVAYLNSSDPYYSTVADAAAEKGWVVEPLV